MTKPTRSYVSSVRAAAAAETRTQVLEAAAGLLREAHFASFTLDSVAKAAGVTRLTIYNQFGSRRGLLEAVFDDLAEKGGLLRIAEAMAMADARQAIERLVVIFCEFWAADRAVGRLNEAIAIDAEFAEAVAARNERRRELMGVLVDRLCAGRRIGARARADAADLLFGLTGYAMFKALSMNRSAGAVRKLVQRMCSLALQELER